LLAFLPPESHPALQDKKRGKKKKSCDSKIISTKDIQIISVGIKKDYDFLIQISNIRIKRISIKYQLKQPV
jgi:hypothetical protein